jgi:hypothetical protein
MTATAPSVAEITTTAISLLCREIGPVNTARFLNQFTTGLGNYTEERDQILGDPTVDELIAEIKQRRAKGKRRGQPSRNRSRARKR